MRKAVVVAVALVVLSPTVGRAHSVLEPSVGRPQVGSDLDQARRDRDAAGAEVARLTAEIRQLSKRYRRLELVAGDAAARLIDASRREMEVQEDLDEARSVLEERASAAYRAGPGALLAAYLEAFTNGGSLADIHAADLFIERALEADLEQATEVLEEHSAVMAARQEVERERRRLHQREVVLHALRSSIEARLVRARAVARAAGLRVMELQREQARLDAAARRDERRQGLVGAPDASLAELLALLGPDGGRGCAIPKGLELTGGSFSGLASWYGWDFAGRPTASGAIYDPRLFTAAHKTLPLNSFLRVRVGSKCAIVLVNDRGPYIEPRVLDLSMAAAKYLGVGVTHVEADILAIK